VGVEVLLFEVETIPLDVLYSVYGLPGIVGLLRGILRWWAGAIWLVGPTLLVTFFYGIVQYDEVSYFYTQGHIEQDYVIHNIAAPLLGIMANLVGIFIGSSGVRVLKREGNLHANTKSIGRI
jgi:hypothetical protein